MIMMPGGVELEILIAARRRWGTLGNGRMGLFFTHVLHTNYTRITHELHTQAVGQKILHTPLILHTFYTPRLVNKGACNPRVKYFTHVFLGPVENSLF